MSNQYHLRQTLTMYIRYALWPLWCSALDCVRFESGRV